MTKQAQKQPKFVASALVYFGASSLNRVDQHLAGREKRASHTNCNGLNPVMNDTFKHQRAKVGKSTIWNHREDDECNHKPSFWVNKTVPNLAIFPVVSLDTHHVFGDSFDRNDFFFLGQESCFVRGVWDQCKPHESNSHRTESQNQVNQLPFFQG
ncbi:hypothetical protein OGATHE_002256 [Ogataea polymorpha]|uniref:Uncharacterized protein n=1 Tax=Ogataea polymorpha TaxID=460523 RepID=A0A9P8PIF5_9ASCO|nr:hypothetical protein OGATHE_002256 [Ogataea polymorpha]